MHLQRVQVPDFRVLKDVDITFEHDFNPRVFPLGSQNGGGKSTLLQLIFTLLHCSTNPNRLFALKNLLSDFCLQEDNDKRIVAKIDIWDGEKIVQLEFFVCNSIYLDKTLKLDVLTNSQHQRNNSTLSLLADIKRVLTHINKLDICKKDLKNIDILNTSEANLVTGIQKLFIDLQEFEIELPKSLLSIPLEQNLVISEFDKMAKKIEIKLDALNIEWNVLELQRKEVIKYLNSKSIEYIHSYKDNINEDKVLLCNVCNLETNLINQFLNKLSEKVFLAAPSTQIFLFFSRKVRKSLFAERNTYQTKITDISGRLSGLFIYEFLAVDILVKAFNHAKDIDFKEAIKTGEYGNNYKNLLKDLELLLNNKKVNLRHDFTGLTFTENESIDKVELEPEDLSHGELKRLSIYIWLKHRNIENAIVLMDEVDIALHPDWQYRIGMDLVEWVSSNQYILATHSYELCESLTPSHVKILEPRLTERQSK